MRFCELLLSSLKIGNNCPPATIQQLTWNRERSLYILRTSESKNLYWERRQETRCELDEMDLARWRHPLQRAEIAHNHYKNKVRCRANGQLSQYSITFMRYETLTAGEESNVASMSEAV
jgi:hypothetical protein